MLLNIKVLLLAKVLLSYSKIQAVQLAVHGNKLAVQITGSALPQRSAATGDIIILVSYNIPKDITTARSKNGNFRQHYSHLIRSIARYCHDKFCPSVRPSVCNVGGL